MLIKVIQMIKIFQSPYLLLAVGYICLLTAIFFAWNIWKTRHLQRSAYFVKAEFGLLATMLLIFIRDICQFYEVKIQWLMVYFQFMYAPIMQILIAVSVLYINLHIRDKWKRQKLI